MTRESSEVLKANRGKNIEENAKAVELEDGIRGEFGEGRGRPVIECQAPKAGPCGKLFSRDGTAPDDRKSVAVETLLKTFEGTAPPHPDFDRVGCVILLHTSYRGVESHNPAEVRDATRGPRSLARPSFPQAAKESDNNNDAKNNKPLSPLSSLSSPSSVSLSFAVYFGKSQKTRGEGRNATQTVLSSRFDISEENVFV